MTTPGRRFALIVMALLGSGSGAQGQGGPPPGDPAPAGSRRGSVSGSFFHLIAADA